MARSTTQPTVERSLIDFAARLRSEVGATRVLLFGSRARGTHQPDSDRDLIIVSERFAGIEPPRRAIGLRALWREASGYGPMDLICVTPEEFARAQAGITLIAAVPPDAIDLLLVEAVVTR
jgi:hypothetical protein